MCPGTWQQYHQGMCRSICSPSGCSCAVCSCTIDVPSAQAISAGCARAWSMAGRGHLRACTVRMLATGCCCYLDFSDDSPPAGAGCSSATGRLLPQLGGLEQPEHAGSGAGALRVPLVSLHQQGEGHLCKGWTRPGFTDLLAAASARRESTTSASANSKNDLCIRHVVWGSPAGRH